MKAGLRYFDIRLRRINNSLRAYHGFVDQKEHFDSILVYAFDFLEKNLYFGLGSPSAFRLILIVGGGTVIIMGSLMYFKWKMGELDF